MGMVQSVPPWYMESGIGIWGWYMDGYKGGRLWGSRMVRGGAEFSFWVPGDSVWFPDCGTCVPMGLFYWSATSGEVRTAVGGVGPECHV
jgi:hypothetical protein